MIGPIPPPPPVAEDHADRGPTGALFWGQDEVIDPDDPDMAALLALQEETPPEERAEAFKDRGNESLKLGTPFHLRQAAGCYSQALAQGHPDPRANSVYLANRAQAHLQLRNWGHALRDGRAAVQLNPGNVKAAFRAAKAAAQLRKHEDVLEMCAVGLSSDATNPELLRLRDAAVAAAEAARLEQLRRQAAADKVELLAAALEVRHLAFGPGRFGESRKPAVDPADGRLRFRMVLMYPESEQTDLIEEMCEDDTLGDHLDAMFGPEAPPLPWDTDGAYTRDKLDVYYHTHLVPAFTPRQLRLWLAEGTPASSMYEADPAPEGDAGSRGGKDARAGGPKLVLVDQGVPMGEVLSGAGHTIAGGTVVFFVLSRNSPFAAQFLVTGLDDK